VLGSGRETQRSGPGLYAVDGDLVNLGLPRHVASKVTGELTAGKSRKGQTVRSIRGSEAVHTAKATSAFVQKLAHQQVVGGPTLHGRRLKKPRPRDPDPSAPMGN
jgi:hypothetical protein